MLTGLLCRQLDVIRVPPWGVDKWSVGYTTGAAKVFADCSGSFAYRVRGPCPRSQPHYPAWSQVGRNPPL